MPRSNTAVMDARPGTLKAKVLTAASKTKKCTTSALAEKTGASLSHVRECLMDAGYSIDHYEGQRAIWTCS